jgi:hypothetical protein
VKFDVKKSVVAAGDGAVIFAAGLNRRGSAYDTIDDAVLAGQGNGGRSRANTGTNDSGITWLTKTTALVPGVKFLLHADSVIR